MISLLREALPESVCWPVHVVLPYVVFIVWLKSITVLLRSVSTVSVARDQTRMQQSRDLSW